MASTEPNDPLAQALADWRVSPSRNPQFRPAVWARLHAARRPSTWTRFARAHPAAVTVLLAAAILGGAWRGRSEARAQTNADRAAIAANYVHSLDARWMRNP